MRGTFPLLVVLALLSAIAACGAPRTAAPTYGIGLNDVSVLFPLPTDDHDADSLLRLSTLGNGGALLTKESFSRLVPVANDVERRPYGSYRIVAARIDPCFPSSTALDTQPASCRRQLRLVAQPLGAVDSSGNEMINAPFGAGDASIHLLYDLDEARFESLTRAWLALATQDTSDRSKPLGVHPTLEAEGLGGPTASAFAALIVEYAGPATLSRATALDFDFASWSFMGVDVAMAGLVPIAVAGLPSNASSSGGTLEQVTVDSGCNGPFDATVGTKIFDQLRILGGRTRAAAGCTIEFPSSSDDIENALKLSLQVDDPTSGFDADTLDCASCHVAGRARAFAMGRGFSTDRLPHYASEGRNLVVPAAIADTITNVRAFGYRGQTALVNQRVIDESAAVADALEARRQP